MMATLIDVLPVAAIPFAFDIPEACGIYAMPSFLFPLLAPLGACAVYGALDGTTTEQALRVSVALLTYAATLGLVTVHFMMCWPE